MNYDHTPGPWHFKGDRIEAPNEGTLCFFEHGPTVADATLMASAPDLLTELDKACNVIAHCISEMPESYREAMRTQLKSGRAAIIKAVAVPV